MYAPLKRTALPFMTFAILFSSCGKDAQRSVSLSATELQNERIDLQAASTEACVNGGTQLRTYIDTNGNSLLDADEIILATSTICAGANGVDGANGTDGKAGVDGQNGANGNDGADGKDGTNGTNGSNGTNGKDGRDGIDAQAPYAIVFAISPTAKGCPTGGSTLHIALDTNRNGVFDDKDEHSVSTEICNGLTITVPVADFSCSVKLKTTSLWKDGYNVDFLIHYQGESRSGWKVEFTLPSEQKLVNLWNALPSALSGKIVASSFVYNEKLERNSKIEFGMQVARTDDLTLSDATIRLNGVLCQN